MDIYLSRAETQEIEEITKIIRQAFLKSKYNVNINPYERKLNSYKLKDKLNNDKVKELEMEIKKMFAREKQEIKKRRRLQKEKAYKSQKN